MTLDSRRTKSFYYHHSLTESPSQEDFNMHAHNDCEIYYFINGGGSYLVEGTKYRLKAGDVLLTRPAESHVYLCEGTKSYERFSLNFSASLFDGESEGESLIAPFFQRELGSRNLYGREDFSSDAYRMLIENMYSAEKNEISAELNIYGNLIAFLFEIRLAFDKKKNETLSHDGKNGVARQVIGYVNDNLFSDLSLQSMSERFFVSPTHLNRLFREYTGTTMWNYVKIKRLLAARAEILSGVPATEAARLCGYGDYSAFYRAYVARFGVNPATEKR